MIQIDEARIRDHLGEMVRGTVEETLNALLEAEADQVLVCHRAATSRKHPALQARLHQKSAEMPRIWKSQLNGGSGWYSGCYPTRYNSGPSLF